MDDREAARRLEGERPSAGLVAGCFDVEPVVLEALVDRVHVRIARLDETDVRGTVGGGASSLRRAPRLAR
jgi:hypothetical protein